MRHGSKVAIIYLCLASPLCQHAAARPLSQPSGSANHPQPPGSWAGASGAAAPPLHAEEPPPAADPQAPPIATAPQLVPLGAGPTSCAAAAAAAGCCAWLGGLNQEGPRWNQEVTPSACAGSHALAAERCSMAGAAP